LLGSHGAASEVRRIDPSTYQLPDLPASERPKQNKTVALLNEADALLVADAKRGHSRGFAKFKKNKIKMGRFS
jgi:hypothetical protein